nr:dehydrodolichyl diphosphate synthase complex subunit NUS1 [Bactrocera oleae]
MFDYLYQLMWLVLHILVNVYETLHFLFLRFQATLLWSYDLQYNSTTITRRDRAFLQRCKAELTKLPRHLNIIIGTDPLARVNESVVARILLYAQIIGIDCVSLYDVRSELDGHILKEKLCKSSKSYWNELQHNHFEWGLDVYTPETKDLKTNGCMENGVHSDNGSVYNGDVYQKKAPVYLKIYNISGVDNQSLIAKICRELFQQRESSKVQNLLADRKQLEQHISDELAKHIQWNCVDPELSIIFNRDMCTFGMLPWQTRFTEFHTFETGRYVNVESFIKLLYKYSKCEQRWGK